MQISNKYIAVEKVEEPVSEGFQSVQVQDNSTYKGKVVKVGDTTNTMSVHEGDIVLFAKYSPDTHEIEHEGKKLKFVKIDDVLAVL